MGFPTSLPSYTGFTNTHTLAEDSHASQHNLEQADITALGTKVGTGSSTPSDNAFLVGNGAGTSSWEAASTAKSSIGLGNVDNTSDDTKNSAIATLTNKTLTSPTIADFTNATHTHAANSSGGTLDGGTAIQTGTITPTQIQNRTRTLTMFTRADGVGNCNETGDYGPGGLFTGTATGYFRGYAITPNDISTGTNVSITLVTRSDSTNSSKNTVHFVGSQSDGDSTSSVWNIGSGVSQNGISWTANTLKYLTLTTKVPSPVAGDLIVFAFNIGTALTGNIYIESAYITYTSDS